MSSNTLRGIGREGDGDDDPGADAPAAGSPVSPPNGEGEAKVPASAGPEIAGADGRTGGEADGETGPATTNESTQSSPSSSASSSSSTTTTSSSAPPPETEQAVDRAGDGMQEPRKFRSLDSAVPGTMSLDSGVPDAASAPDEKVPALAATLIGVSPPSLLLASARDIGTVHGRDVHLPLASQLAAGLRSGSAPSTDSAVASAPPQSGPFAARPFDVGPPAPIDRTERLSGVFRVGGVAHQGSEGGPGSGGLSSHARWYEQEASGADVYDDPKASILGRAAIGVAVAAGLSILLFAVIRLNAQNSKVGAPANQWRAAEGAVPLPAPPPTAAPTPNSAARAAGQPGDTLRTPVAEPEAAEVRSSLDSPEPAPAAGTELAASSPGAAEKGEEKAEEKPEEKPATTPRRRPPDRAAAAPAGSARSMVEGGRDPREVPSSRPTIPGDTQRTASLSGGAGNSLSGAPATTPPPVPRGGPTDSTTTTTGRPAGLEKPRPRSGYDPDSTLPLNLD